MPTTGNPTIDLIFVGVGATVILFLGYRLGRFFGNLAATRAITEKEQELLTAQKGFKNLYEQEINHLKSENAKLQEQIAQLNTRVEEYRKKGAGFGLFSGGGERADATPSVALPSTAEAQK